MTFLKTESDLPAGKHQSILANGLRPKIFGELSTLTVRTKPKKRKNWWFDFFVYEGHTIPEAVFLVVLETSWERARHEV
jgi:hypothetical protein